jgi:hypothetical protein
MFNQSQIYFVLSYDPIAQNIEAHFATEDPDGVSNWEHGVMQMMGERFVKISETFINQPICAQTLYEISNNIKNCLNDVERETGLKIELDNSELRLKYS